MRVPVASEDNYRVYGHTVASALRSVRPHLKVVVVSVAGLRELDAEVAHFDPRLVISSNNSRRQVFAPLTYTQPSSRLSWVELSVGPDQPSLICVDGQRWDLVNPSLQELLDIVEKTELILVEAGQKTGEEEGDCWYQADSQKIGGSL